MFESFGLEGSAKKNIIFLLSQEWPLGVKEIHSKLERQGITVSYQAVHKAVGELVDQGILGKRGSEFQLNEDWIQSNKQFFEKLGKDYENKAFTDLEKPIYLSFDSLQALQKFLANDFYVKYPNPERKNCACVWKHAYFSVGATEREINNLRKFLTLTRHYALTKYDTALDRFFSDFFTKLGKECYTNVRIPVKNDTFVQGDFVCQIFFPEEILSEWHKIYSKYSKLDEKTLDELFKLIGKKTEINVLIVKNASFADKIRKDCERIIEKLKKKKTK